MGHWRRFCDSERLQLRWTSLSLQEYDDALTNFVGYLSGLASINRYTTIRAYLYHVRDWHLHGSLGRSWLRFCYRAWAAVRGYRRLSTRLACGRQRKKMGITLPLLRRMLRKLPLVCSAPLAATLRATFLTAFWLFARCSEYSVGDAAFDPDIHLCIGDVHFGGRLVDATGAPSRAVVHVKSSKGDPFRQGVDVPLVAVAAEPALCPVAALHFYFLSPAKRYELKSACCFTVKGAPLTRRQITYWIRYLVSRDEVHGSTFRSEHWSTHSFRYGAATSLYHTSADNLLVQRMGRWRSPTYEQYTAPSLAQVQQTVRLMLTSKVDAAAIHTEGEGYHWLQ